MREKNILTLIDILVISLRLVYQFLFDCTLGNEVLFNFFPQTFKHRYRYYRNGYGSYRRRVFRFSSNSAVDC